MDLRYLKQVEWEADSSIGSIPLHSESAWQLAAEASGDTDTDTDTDTMLL